MVTVPSCTRLALCIGFQRVSRRYIAGWRGSSENPAFFYRCTKDSNVDPTEVSKNGRILLANLLQSSSSTFSCVCFPGFFAFQDGMWDTQISALLSSQTVSGRILLANLHQSSRSTFSRGSFRSSFAFKEGILGTPISAPGGWPTVSGRFV